MFFSGIESLLPLAADVVEHSGCDTVPSAYLQQLWGSDLWTFQDAGELIAEPGVGY